MSGPDKWFRCSDCGEWNERTQIATTEDGELLREELYCTECERRDLLTISKAQLRGMPVQSEYVN